MEDFKQDNEYKVNLGTWRKILSIVFKKHGVLFYLYHLQRYLP